MSAFLLLQIHKYHLNNNDPHITQKSCNLQWNVHVEQRTVHMHNSNQTVAQGPNEVFGTLPEDPKWQISPVDSWVVSTKYRMMDLFYLLWSFWDNIPLNYFLFIKSSLEELEAGMMKSTSYSM